MNKIMLTNRMNKSFHFLRCSFYILLSILVLECGQTVFASDNEAIAVQGEEPAVENSNNDVSLASENSIGSSEVFSSESVPADSTGEVQLSEESAENAETSLGTDVASLSESESVINESALPSAGQNSEQSLNNEENQIISPQAEMTNVYSDNSNVPDAKVNIVGDPNNAQDQTPMDEQTLMQSTANPPDMEDGNENNADTEAPKIKEEPVHHANVYYGFPKAQLALKEMAEDVVGGINTRRVNSIYGKWRKYAASILAKTNRLSTGLELNNRCRLRWYDQLYRDPITSVFYVEAFSRDLFENLASDTTGVIRGVRQMRSKLDISLSNNEVRNFDADDPEQAINFMKVSLVKAANAHSRALAPLTPAEIKTISKESFTVFSSQTRVGHTVPSVGRAQYLIDLMEKMDYGAMFDAAEYLIPLTDPNFIEALKKITPDMFESANVGGNRCQRVATPAGDILISGSEDNTWDLDALENVVCVIDLGGNDTYKEGVCNPGRPILVLLDLGNGRDKYVGTRPGVQGGSILGVSLLFNEAGDTAYSARDIAQGSSIGGIGILIDNDGDDNYLGFKRVQATAICGLGFLLDRNGNDDYRAALLAQAVGNSRGFAALADVKGNDHYYVGGYYLDSYPDYPGLDGWGQGLGAGIRGVADGGIGAFMEGDGDDVYEYDYFGHGGGYWMGIGFARDFGGNDRRLGATLKGYNGMNRIEARHQRFSNGFGCHYALGFLFDDGGDDFYDGTIMGLGMGWDLGAGFLVDYAGNDVYAATGGLTQGTGAEGSLGFLFDNDGKDLYRGVNQAYALSRITYHSAYDCGGNFSFLVDHGGIDEYGCRAQNNAMTQRGTNTGFLIDRPTAEELAEMKEKGETVALDDKTPLHDSSQGGGAYDPNVERANNQLTNSVNPNAGPMPGGNGGFGGGGFWGGGRGFPGMGQGMGQGRWPF